jgi:hypothetical protein
VTTIPDPAAQSAPSRAGRGWAYTGTILGVVTSVAANIAHTYVPPTTGPATTAWTPEPGAVIGALFWPLALLVASEVLARKRWAGPFARVVGIAAVLLVGTVAAVISYMHMHGLLLHYQETPLAAAIGPLAIDGLMLISSLALVAKDAPTTEPTPADRTPIEPAPVEPIPQPADPTPIEPVPAEPDRTTAVPINGSTPNGHPHPINGSTTGTPDRIDVRSVPITETTGSTTQGTDRSSRSTAPIARPADVQRARDAIRAQLLPDRPTAEAIRRHLGISPAYARATREALAHTVTTPEAAASAGNP